MAALFKDWLAVRDARLNDEARLSTNENAGDKSDSNTSSSKQPASGMSANETDEKATKNISDVSTLKKKTSSAASGATHVADVGSDSDGDSGSDIGSNSSSDDDGDSDGDAIMDHIEDKDEGEPLASKKRVHLREMLRNKYRIYASAQDRNIRQFKACCRRGIKNPAESPLLPMLVGVLSYHSSLAETSLPVEWFAFKRAHPIIALVLLESARLSRTLYGKKFKIGRTGRKYLTRDEYIHWPTRYTFAHNCRKGAASKRIKPSEYKLFLRWARKDKFSH